MNMWARFVWFFFSWRFRSKVQFFDDVDTPFRVWPTDLDMNFHMNNGIYLSLMDFGRYDLLLRTGLFKKMQHVDWYPVVASQMIRYRKSLEPFQRFTLRTKLVGWDERFFYIQQKFMLKGEVAALAVVKGRFLSKKGQGVHPGKLAELAGESPVSPTVPAWMLGWAEAEHTGWKTEVG